MSLVLKSNGVYVGDSMFPISDAFIARVLADGGEIIDEDQIFSAEIFIRQNALQNKIFSLVSPAFAVKKAGNAVSKIYSLLGADGDFVIEAGASPTFNSDNTVAITGLSANKYKTQSDAPSGSISLLTAFTTTVNTSGSPTLMNAYNPAGRCLDGLYIGSNKTLAVYGVADVMAGATIPAITGKNTFAIKTSAVGMTAIANGTKYNFPASYRNVGSATIRYASAPTVAGMTANYSAFATCIDMTDEELSAFEQYLRSAF